MKPRFWYAMGAYVILGAIAWFTLPDMRFRGAVLLLLGGLAVKTVIARAAGW